MANYNLQITIIQIGLIEVKKSFCATITLYCSHQTCSDTIGIRKTAIHNDSL